MDALKYHSLNMAEMDKARKLYELEESRRVFQEYGQLIWLAGAIYTLIAVPLGAPLLPDITISQHVLIGIGFSILLIAWLFAHMFYRYRQRRLRKRMETSLYT